MKPRKRCSMKAAKNATSRSIVWVRRDKIVPDYNAEDAYGFDIEVLYIG